MKKIFALYIILLSGLGAESDAELFNRLQNHITRISEDLRESVVHIKVSVRKNNRKYWQYGSGFVLNKEGHIFTNQHVVDGATEVLIRMYEDPSEYKAEILGADDATDVALLKIEARALPKMKPVKLGKSATTRVGQWVLAVGNPYGFDRTVSFGIISAKGRNLPDAPVLNEFIQTDAMIASGSSGGPLLDLNGTVIGINSRASTKGTIGFTIPIEVALDVKEKFLKEGKIQRGWLGMELSPLSLELRKLLSLPETRGVLVTYVSEISDAHNRIRPYDLLISVNGKAMDAIEDKDITTIERNVAAMTTGSEAKVRFLNRRTGKEEEIRMKIGDLPEKDPKSWESDLGFVVKNINEFLYNRYLLEKRSGVYVSHVESGSEAKQANLLPGDIILEVDGIPLENIEQVKTHFNGKSPSGKYLLKILRGREYTYCLIRK